MRRLSRPDAGVEEGKVVAVHVDEGVDGVLVPVYQGGEDVERTADKDRE